MLRSDLHVSRPRQPTLTTDARLQVAEAADASGDSELAISMYTEAAASEPANIALQLRCADALARYGKITQARQMLTERLRSNPGQPDLIRALALIDLVAGQPAQAIAGLDQVLAANPADIRALVDKAVALDLQGQHAAAQAIYQAGARDSRPMMRPTRNDLAMSHDAGGAHRAGAGDARADAGCGHLAAKAQGQPGDSLCRHRRSRALATIAG